MNSMIETVTASLTPLARVRPARDGVKVTTHCLYPSGGSVHVSVIGGVDTFIVSDDGAAFNEALAAGVTDRVGDSTVRSMLPDSCSVRGGVIRSETVSRDELGFAILAVANASKDAADHLFRTLRIKRTYNFKEMVASVLRETFNDRVRHNEIIFGKSNKSYEFDNVVSLESGRRLIVDAVINDANSRNARLVANLDVKQTHRDDISQRIVFDDADSWSPSDLVLLTMGATMVPYSKSREAFLKFAA